LLERALLEPRHVEIQVFGDSHGQIVHLGERDCSVQRRHQKVIEEAPSSAVNADLRARMGAAAVQAARSIDYVGAGTVEFLLDADGMFYFLEMNTRLQVEHAVTEMVTGLDLVELQLDVAAGKALPFGQHDVTLQGHAIEARLYAEDPAIGFLPQTGRVALWDPATCEGLRIDHGILEGTLITPFYDPMIAKVIARGTDREEARRRLVQGLRNTTVLGVTTNKLFLIDVLQEEEFVRGEATTGFIARHFPAQRFQRPGLDPEAVALAAVLFAEHQGAGWRSSAWLEHRIILRTGEQRVTVHLHRSGDAWEVKTDEFSRQICVRERNADAVSWLCNGQVRRARYVMQGAELSIDTGANIYVFSDETNAPSTSGGAERSGDLRAPMSGLVIALHVAIGDRVKRGQVVAVLEAMKMEHQLIAAMDGVVAAVAVAKGTQVGPKTLLVSIRSETATV
jgi:geranyl-CoA carboxylase alpha subunit